MTRILVTGGSGFIGTNVVEHFRAQGHAVLNADRLPPRNADHQGLWVPVDLLDSEALSRLLVSHDPEVVFHLAARTDLQGATIADYPANTQGVSNLIQALTLAPSLRLAVFASSMLVCRIGYHPSHTEDYCPTTAYGESKVAGERLVRQEAGDRFPWVIVRPTSIWGPWFGPPYRDFFTAVRRGLYVHPRGYRIHRSYGFVLNAVAQLDHLWEQQGGPFLRDTIYLADPQPIELKQWADVIQRSLGVRPVREVPIQVLRVLAKAGDMVQRLGWRTPPMTSFRLNNLLTDMIHDTTPWQQLGDIPYHSLDESVRLTCEWMRNAKV